MSASEQNRVRARYRAYEEAGGETALDVETAYQFPLTDVTNGAKTATHEPIGTDPVIQHLGTEATQLTFRGHCYWDEATSIYRLSNYPRVDVRADDWTGSGVATKSTVTAENAGGGKAGRNIINDRIYRYRITLVATDDATNVAAAPGENPGL